MKYIIINGQEIPSEILELSDIQIIDEGTLKGKKEAYKIKGKFAARMTPFIGIIDENGKIQKGFYSEASTNVFKDFIDYEKCK